LLGGRTSTRPKWKVEPFEYKTGEIDNDFKNIVLRFNASNALKALAHDALGVAKDDILLYGEITIDPSLVPRDEEQEYQYAPFALAVAPDFLKTKDWRGSWPQIIGLHVEHWSANTLARRYAEDDVKYTRDLYKHFGCPEMNDNDSVLACLVATCRWKGFAVDLEGIKNLRNRAIALSTSAPTAPEQVREYIYSHLSETERVVLQESSKHNLAETTKKIVLEEISRQTQDCECIENSIPKHNCLFCSGTGIRLTNAGKLAKKVLEARLANYEINFYDKLLTADRLHADAKVIGSLSGRMSGASGINALGIKKSKDVRSCFPLAFLPCILCGGDFISYEVVLADAKYDDPELRKALQTIITCPFCGGDGCRECNLSGQQKQTIHGLFGTFMYPGMSYVDILRTKGTADDKYTRAKSGVFTNLYGGTAHALKERLDIPIEVGERAYEGFNRRYKKVGQERQKIANMFQAMKQPNGIGTRVEWHEPADKIESMFGFPRYFTLENAICKALFEIAERPPEDWLKTKIKVVRRDRLQDAGGAVRSALFAAAFQYTITEYQSSD
jgi:hypothetical protein